VGYSASFLSTGVETAFGTMVPKSWVAPWCLVPFEKSAPVPPLFQNWHRCPFFKWHWCHCVSKLAPVPIEKFASMSHFFKIGTGASFSNGIGANICNGTGANFSNGTGATAFQNWHRYLYSKAEVTSSELLK